MNIWKEVSFLSTSHKLEIGIIYLILFKIKKWSNSNESNNYFYLENTNYKHFI